MSLNIFNNDNKNNKLYSNVVKSISGDDLIIKSYNNSKIKFVEGDNIYSLNNFTNYSNIDVSDISINTLNISNDLIYKGENIILTDQLKNTNSFFINEVSNNVPNYIDLVNELFGTILRFIDLSINLNNNYYNISNAEIPILSLVEKNNIQTNNLLPNNTNIMYFENNDVKILHYNGYKYYDYIFASENISLPLTVLEPSLVLLGNSNITSFYSRTYSDPGITILNNTDNIIPTVTNNVDISNIGTYTITWDISYIYNGISTTKSIQRTVNIIYPPYPVITLNGSYTVDIEPYTPYIDASATAIDICDGAIQPTMTGTVDVSTVGTYVITWTATNSNNFSTSVNRYVNVLDSLPFQSILPDISLVGDTSINHLVNTPYTDLGATAVDSQDVSLTPVMTGIVDVSQVGLYMITWTATDSSNNSKSVYRYVDVKLDIGLPVIILNGSYTVDISQYTIYQDAGATAIDICDGAITPTMSGTVDISTVGTYVITWTAIDNHNNISRVNRYVNVKSGVSAPTMDWIWPSENSIVSTLYDYHPRIGNGLTIVNGWTNDFILSLAGYSWDSNEKFHTRNEYGVNGTDYIDFIFTFADANTWCSGYRQYGHIRYPTSTFTKDIEIYIGNANASSSRPPSSEWTLVTTGSHSNWHNNGTNTFTDSGTTTEWNPTAPSKYLLVRTLTNHGDTNNGGRISVRYLQLKAAVGSGSGSVLFQNTLPDISLVGDTSINHLVNTPYTDLGATAVSSQGETLIPVTSNFVDVTQLGLYMITWTATDSSGNSKSVYRYVDVKLDAVPPVIILTGSYTVDISQNSSYQDAGATAIDICDGAIEPTMSGTVDISTVGTYVITWTAIDSNNNISRVNRYVNVKSGVSAPIPLSISTLTPSDAGTGWALVRRVKSGVYWHPTNDNLIGSSVYGTPSTDQADSTWSIKYDDISFNEFLFTTGDMTYWMIMSKFQAIGEYYENTFRIITKSHTNSSSYEARMYNRLSNSEDPWLSYGHHPEGILYGESSTMYHTHLINNNNGANVYIRNTSNTSNTTGTSILPDISLVGDISINHLVNTPYTDLGATAVSSQGETLTPVKTGTVHVGQVGLYMITWTATDSSGNSKSVYRYVDVKLDFIPPVITISGSDIVYILTGSTYIDAGATALDNSDGNITSQIQTTNTVNTAVDGSYSVTYRVSDNNNNTTTAVRTVIVRYLWQDVDSLLVGPFTTATQITIPKILPKGTSAYTIHFTFNSSGSARSMLFVGWYSAVADKQLVTIMSYTSPHRLAINHYSVNRFNSYDYSVIFDGNDHTVTITKDNGSPSTATLYVDGLQRDTVSVTGPIYMTDTTTLYIGDGTGIDTTLNLQSGESIKNVAIRDSVHIPPIMNILGNNPATIARGTTYIDAGATALDYNNNNSSLDISTVNLVNPNIDGSYSVTYTAIDASGIESIAIRKVIVILGQPTINLVGGDLILNKGFSYASKDPGYTAKDYLDNNLTAELNYGGLNNMSVGQNYVVTYTVTDPLLNTTASTTRNVSIIHVNPTITVNGGNVSITGGTTYIDDGATAIDYYDDGVTVSTENPVNTNLPGQYTVIYTATDDGQNTSTDTRSVTVNSPTSVISNTPESGRTYSTIFNHWSGYSTLDNQSYHVASWNPASSEWTAGGSWMQVNLGYNRTVTGVVTQGRGKGPEEWVTSYSVKYNDGNSWLDINSGQSFTANYDMHTKVYNNFTAVYTQSVRIYPQTWYGGYGPYMRGDVMVWP